MSGTRDSQTAASSVSTKFMFATVFLSIGWFTGWLALFGAALFAVWGTVALYTQSRRTSAPNRGGAFTTGLVSAFVFVVVAFVQLGYSAGKYVALQKNAACSAVAQDVPNSSFEADGFAATQFQR